MPYKVVPDKGKFAIINLDTGAVVGHSDTEAMAWSSVGHRQAAENETPSERKARKAVHPNPSLPMDAKYTPAGKSGTLHDVKRMKGRRSR